MPRKPTPPPPELEQVRKRAAQLARIEALADRVRAKRNEELVTAKLAGATGAQLAEAAGLTRRNVYDALAAAGHDAGAWRETDGTTSAGR
ncbi:hypothetical protein [Amycolatopsis methanolica]|uniref:Uncharacterized protein n=1 Tax=Amycolatopsis methanolica 239 TaxID=1068978 RepID=A0A076N8N3_AMYME|nr:hypothetical protein [Amycolatopsis methanolica]AIJ26373.1 hypothetical protein AMETH_6281 [Amycolatopsis methanolica 239]AIJ26432.1 hypothetical protein AMETH_6340 [Amycolatopsis methanolica 239]